MNQFSRIGKAVTKERGLFLIFLIVTAACHSTHSETKTSALPDSINAAVELSSVTLTPNGDTLSGFSFELLEEICSEHGIPVTFNAFNNVEDAFESESADNYDVYVSNMPVTSSLKKKYILTSPIFTDTQVLVQNADIHGDSLIRTQQQLGGRTVWITKNTAVTERIRNLSEEIGAPIIIADTEGLSEEQLIIMIAMGEIPRGVASRMVANELKKIYPQLDIDTRLSFKQFRAWILAPQDTLLRDSLDSWLDDFRSTPRYEELKGKYDIND